MHRGACPERIYERICHSVCASGAAKLSAAGETIPEIYPFLRAASDGACSIETAVCTVWRKRYVYEKMAYAQCMEKLSEFSRDTQKIAYLNQDRYRTEYENVIADNIREKVDDMLQEYGLGTESVTVELGEDNIMQESSIYITDESEDTISVGRSSVSDADESGENQEC